MKVYLNLYLLVICLSLSERATGQYIDPLLPLQFESASEVTYLIQMKGMPDLSQAESIKGKDEKAAYVYKTLEAYATESQKSIREFLEKSETPYQYFIINNSLKVTSEGAIFTAISQRQDVGQLIWDKPTPMQRVIEETPIVSTRDPEPEWGIKMIAADQVWEQGIRGQGVVVGGQDTGFDWLVSPLQRKYRGFISDSLGNHNYNWHDAIHEPSPLHADSINPCGFDVMYPCDDHNHGTHTMGTMVGSDTANAIGVAPDAAWVACRNMDRGYGSPSTYLECFEWFLAPTDLQGNNPDPTKAPHVINNSWSCPEMEGCNPDNWHILETAVTNLRRAGTVVVVSAGNDGPECNTIANPAAIFEGSFTVGATTDIDSIAGFSSRGAVASDSSYRIKPNVAAPGRRVRSVIRNGEYRSWSGTSMAGPHVAGLVALIISANPDLAGEVELIEDIIEASADPLITTQNCDNTVNSNLPNNTYGYGRINALKAVAIAKNIDYQFAANSKDWTYEAVNFVGSNDVYTMSSVGEVEKEGKKSIQLDRTKALCDLAPSTLYLHTYLNKVNYFNDQTDSFQLLYDFNKKAGESYTTSLSFSVFDNYEIENKVLAWDTIVFDDVEMPAQIVQQTVYATNAGNIDTVLLSRLDTITREFGSLHGLLFEEQLFCDGALTKRLRCYNDENFSIELIPDGEECGIISNTNNIAVSPFELFPNPTGDNLYIKSSYPVNYTISTIKGQQLLLGRSKNGAIDVSELLQGIYIISFEGVGKKLKFAKI